MPSPRLQSALNKLKSKMQQPPAQVGSLSIVDTKELSEHAKKQTHLLEGIEDLLSDDSKLDQLDKSVKSLQKSIDSIQIPDRVTVANLQGIIENSFRKLPKTYVPDKVKISNLDELSIDTSELKEISRKLDQLKIKWPKEANEPIPVRLSDGEEFYKVVQQMTDAVKILGGGSSGEVFEDSRRATVRPQTVRVSGKEYVAVVNPDGTSIGSGSGGTAAYSDSGGTDQKGLVDGDRHVQVDVLTMPTVSVTGTFWQATQPVSIAQDVMLGTDFSDVFGTASLIIATQADNIANTQDTIATSAFLYGFDGSTWDRLNASGGNLLVNVQNFAVGQYGNADNAAANLTSALTWSGILMYDASGGNWDRVRGDTTNGLDVDVTRTPRASTSSVTSVNDAATSVTLLSANANRLSVRIFNDSTAILYVKLGTTASSTDYSVKLQPDDYYEDDLYTGRIDGIWASDASGAAKITELSA